MAQPGVDLRTIASAFWATDVGREVSGGSQRVGNFTIDSVDAIEQYANRRFSAVGCAPPGSSWPWIPPDDNQELILSWGAIVGEVILSLYSEHWETDPASPSDQHLFRVVIGGGVVAWPIAQVHYRLARGISHDLSVYVDVVGRVVGRQAVGGRAWH